MLPPTATMWVPALDELRLVAPELILTGTIVAVLLVPIFTGRNAYLAAVIALAGTVASLLATGPLTGRIAEAPTAGLAPPGSTPTLVVDRFALFFRLLLLTFLMLITWLWLIGIGQTDPAAASSSPLKLAGTSGSAESSVSGPVFFALLLTSALGMMLMVSTLNLLVLVVAMETASLPSYAIVASDRRSRLGAEAGLKYVVFGAAAAAIMVYGISLLYGCFGTLDLGIMARSIQQGQVTTSPLFWLGLAGLGAGIAFKIAAVPMHFWCPDVFEGAPIEVTTWLSVASKAAGLGVLLRVVDTLAGGVAAVTPLTWCVGAIAAITCTVGNLAALRQESVKRILAYSSIAHAGYMMMAGAILLVPGGQVNRGVGALVSYLLVYVIMNLGAFGATALVVWQTGSDHLSAFTGLGRRAPWLAVPMAVCLFSLVGLPPLGGFAAKWFLLLALGRAAGSHPWLWTLVIIAVLNTAISLYYYVRIVRQMYLADEPGLPALRPPIGGLAVVNLCALMLVLLGTLWFNPLGRRAEAMAVGLYRTPAPAWVDSTPLPAPRPDG